MEHMMWVYYKLVSQLHMQSVQIKEHYVDYQLEVDKCKVTAVANF